MSLVLAFLLVNGLLLAPRWGAPGMVPAYWLALESVVVVVVFAALPRNRWSLALAVAVSLTVVVTALVGLGDATTRMSLSRPLNLYLDVRLLSAVFNLLTGTMGSVVAVLARIAAVAVPLLLVGLLGHLLAPPRSVPPLIRGPRGAGVTVAVLVALGVGLRASDEFSQGVGLPGVRLAVEQTRFFRALQAERETFEVELAERAEGFADTPDLFGRLGGRDVLMAFVESYGMSALDDPRYAPVIRPRLAELETRLGAAGLHLATGRLVAPSQGGQSWLGHASMLSGLWLGNQMRYDLMLASGRKTLIDDFRSAGYRTVALMPAITLAWPEGALFRYDEIYGFDQIGYVGPPLNWVTMPDQFTWSFLERSIRRSDPEARPLFAELGLISSHAPWTPILPVLDDWESIGDGAVFEPWRDAGDRPEDLWRDTERVREQYALSVDYALHAMTAYAERYIGEDALLIVLGDHQPAPLVTGDGAPRTVPVHVISGDAELVRPFLDWGFQPGAFPDPDAEPKGMDHFRPWFVDAFSGSGGASAIAGARK
ncbi:MAG: hypothetical protein WD995_10220 [Gemmatimonadota bacterium]